MSLLREVCCVWTQVVVKKVVEYIRVNVSCQWNTFVNHLQKCEIAKVSVKTFESSRSGGEEQ